MSTKAAVIEMIQRMPDEVTVVEIIAELQVRQKIENGLRQLDAGQGIDHEEVQKRLAKWLA
jgi:predicted transcriptional regulator